MENGTGIGKKCDVFLLAIEEIERDQREREKERIEIERRTAYKKEQAGKEVEMSLFFPDKKNQYGSPAKGTLALKFMSGKKIEEETEDKDEKTRYADKWTVKCNIEYAKDPQQEFDSFEEAMRCFRSILTEHEEEITAARNAELDREISSKEKDKTNKEKYRKEHEIRAWSLLTALGLYLFVSLLITALYLHGISMIIVLFLDLVISGVMYYGKKLIRDSFRKRNKKIVEIQQTEKSIAGLEKEKKKPLMQLIQ